LCRIRELSLARSSRKLTDLRDTALYSFTGTFRSPKLIDPLQIALAIVAHFLNLASLPGYPRSGATNLAHSERPTDLTCAPRRI
jgi:hypothetical protein